MRISPDGLADVHVAGLGSTPPAPLVTVTDDSGVAVALAPGHSPRWYGGRDVVFGAQQDGPPLQRAAAPSWSVGSFPLPSGNSVTAAAGRAAVHRTDPRRELTSDGHAIGGATDGVYSDDGLWLAYLLPDVPVERVSRLVVGPSADPHDARILWEGSPLNPRFGGTTVAFEVGSGRVGACVDVSNPTQPAIVFPLPEPWRISKPVPVWHAGRGELLLLFVADDGARGHVMLATWSSLTLGRPEGWVVAVSTGSAYDHDARPVAPSPSLVAVCWLAPDGRRQRATLDVASPRLPLSPPNVPPEPEPPDPEPEPPDPEPEPEPPDPKPEPEPEPDPMLPTVDMIPRDQTVMAGQSIDDYLKGNPRLGLPAGIFPEPFDGQPMATKLDVTCSYLLGVWCPYVCTLGSFPGDAAGWDERRRLGLDHTFHVIEAERGEPQPGPEPPQPGALRGPIGVDGRHFVVP